MTACRRCRCEHDGARPGGAHCLGLHVARLERELAAIEWERDAMRTERDQLTAALLSLRERPVLVSDLSGPAARDAQLEKVPAVTTSVGIPLTPTGTLSPPVQSSRPPPGIAP